MTRSFCGEAGDLASAGEGSRVTLRRSFLAVAVAVLLLMGGCVAHAIQRDGWDCYRHFMQSNLPEGHQGCPAKPPAGMRDW
jgi:hypothetical protein